MSYSEIYNSEGYLDMTFYLAIRSLLCDRKDEPKTMKKNDEKVYRRGEIYLVNLEPHIGSEQGGVRPVVVLQNNAGNLFAPTLIVAPISSRYDKKKELPTHYYVGEIDGLDRRSVVLLEQIMTVDKSRVYDYKGKVTRRQMEGIDAALEVSLGLRIPEDVEAP